MTREKRIPSKQKQRGVSSFGGKCLRTLFEGMMNVLCDITYTGCNFFLILLDGILMTLLSVPLMSLLGGVVLSFSIAHPDTMNSSTTSRAVSLVSDIKSVQRLTSTAGRSLNPLQLPTKLVDITSTKTWSTQNKVNRRITTIKSTSADENITNNVLINYASENNHTSDSQVDKGYGDNQLTANATTSNLANRHEADVSLGGSEISQGNHTTLPFQKITSLGSEAIWIINGSLLLFLCLAGLLLSLYLRKSSSRGSDGSINPKNKSIKVLAIAGGIVTAVSDTTAQEKVDTVPRN